LTNKERALRMGMSAPERNDERLPVIFKAVASVSCFELRPWLWLLVHFEDIRHPIGRVEVTEHLKRHIPYYEKTLAARLPSPKLDWMQQQSGRKIWQQRSTHTRSRNPILDSISWLHS